MMSAGDIFVTDADKRIAELEGKLKDARELGLYWQAEAELEQANEIWRTDFAKLKAENKRLRLVLEVIANDIQAEPFSKEAATLALEGE